MTKASLLLAGLVVAALLVPIVHGEALTDPVTGIQFILVKGGCYTMADRQLQNVDEKLQEEVCVPDYYLGKYEVTQGEWKTVMGFNPSYFQMQEGPERRFLCGLTICPGPPPQLSGDLFPVEQVSWDEVQEFIIKLNRRAGTRYRLPTEAEWEFAATGGGIKQKWAGTDFITDLWKYAWYADTSEYRTQAVGQKMPNQLGFYDMTGNVWEWMDDSHPSDYKQTFKKQREIIFPGAPRSVRGGGWYDPPWFTITAVNEGMHPTTKSNSVGFRLAFSAQEPARAPREPAKIEPAPAVPATPPAAGPAPAPGPVYFDLDKHNIRPDAAEALKKDLEWFKQNPGKKVRIEGNADERANRKYNVALGKRRAESVKRYLIELGVDPGLLEIVSYGKERPVCVERLEDCYWKNRRVDLKPVQ
jgi:formylglycine-generating enzyme